MAQSFNELKITALKIQLSGEAKAHRATLEKLKAEKVRADGAERRERELTGQYRTVKDRADFLASVLKSKGVVA
jgi:hypothetical protein